MRIIFLIMIGLSLLQADFTKSGDIVTDSSSGLEWQDNALGNEMKWMAAISHCENLTLGIHSDWRLPNINELSSTMIDRSGAFAVPITAFETRGSNYWSSTTHEFAFNGAPVRNAAWTFYFSASKNNDYNVRCVRGGE